MYFFSLQNTLVGHKRQRHSIFQNIIFKATHNVIAMFNMRYRNEKNISILQYLPFSILKNMLPIENAILGKNTALCGQ